MLESAKRNTTGKLLNQQEAAEFLGVSASWLEKRRGPKGIAGGPPYCHLGGFVRYRKSELEEYVRSLKTGPLAADDNAGKE